MEVSHGALNKACQDQVIGQLIAKKRARELRPHQLENIDAVVLEAFPKPTVHPVQPQVAEEKKQNAHHQCEIAKAEVAFQDHDARRIVRLQLFPLSPHKPPVTPRFRAKGREVHSLPIPLPADLSRESLVVPVHGDPVGQAQQGGEEGVESYHSPSIDLSPSKECPEQHQEGQKPTNEPEACTQPPQHRLICPHEPGGGSMEGDLERGTGSADEQRHHRVLADQYATA